MFISIVYTILYMLLNAYTIILLVIGLVLIGLVLQVALLKQRIKLMTRGKNAKSLEETIMGIVSDIDTLQNNFSNHSNQLQILENKTAGSIRGVGTIRFNPFKNAGGNQSFATAFTNEHGDGVIISTLYGRERVSLFAKPIIGWKSEFELTPEEGIALSNAKTYQSEH